jgi:hypothetical protein
MTDNMVLVKCGTDFGDDVKRSNVGPEETGLKKPCRVFCLSLFKIEFVFVILDGVVFYLVVLTHLLYLFSFQLKSLSNKSKIRTTVA